ncbi:MAG: restriction endonuclease subunit M, partial [Leptospiraceae bacterium]|nr:restriction endonuclease subunit M [Leptospiraceae bacterium]
MSKVEQLKSKFLEIQSIDDVYNYFSFLGFQVRENDGAFIFNIAEDEFIEIFFYEEKSEINKRINSFTYNRYCVLAVPQDFSSMTFVKIGYEGKSKIVRYTIKKEEIRNRENPIGIQRVSKLKYEQIETFDDLFDRKDVSKRFYTDYSKKRLQLVKQIQGVADPDDKRLYAQVLLDRIIFLYFLQKKHLLEKDERYLVRKLAEYENKKSNFYENFLKRFFLETLCVKLEDRDASWIQETGELIPYLNGGLFLTHELEQKHPDISIPNKAFQEIFAFLESWLWYSSERSDTDEDVIDPYILGYIFEKSLGENKSQGVYYTPPFLSSFLSRETIENFLLYFIQNNLKIKCIKVSEFLSSASEKDLLAYYEKLSNITVCDPACGSGQFLIEALHELSELHLNLLEVVKTNNLESLKKEYKKDMDSPSPSIYTIRRFIVSKNIYGVDLLPEAVEIAKLRLFIAMIEGITDKVEEPLPNIDFHVVCGNSLVGFTSSPFENTGKAEQQGLFPGAKKQQTERLFDFYDIRKSFEEREDLIKAYFSVENPKAALKKRDEIHQKTGALKQLFHKDFNTKISGVWKVKPKNKIDFIDLKKDTSAIKQFKEFKIQAEDLNAFHWVMEFSEIMNKGGFDIMLLNPPWETWKPNSQEFFEKHLDGYRKLDKIQAKKKVEETLKKDTKLKKLWMEYSMGLSSVSEYFRSCEDYPARGKGDINLYKLFLERAF